MNRVEDFGIKFNCENGGSAPEKVTDMIHTITKDIKDRMERVDGSAQRPRSALGLFGYVTQTET